jgi:Transglycosylase SLT domain
VDLADAFINLRPRADRLRAEASAEIRIQTRGLEIEVPVKADTRTATAALGAFSSRLGLTRKAARDAGTAVEDAGASIDIMARSSASASEGAAGLGTGMVALIGAGVALSPVIATLGVGFGGLGLAAYSVVKNTKLMGPILAPLKQQFSQFSESLQPEVLGAFNAGVHIATGLLHDIQPVAAATGKAFNTFLGQVDQMFRSGEWQSFFGWMAREAGPDIKLLGTLFVTAANDIPPLVTALQPLAEGLIAVATDAFRVVSGIEKILGLQQQMNQQKPQHQGWFDVNWLAAATHLVITAGAAGSKAFRQWVFGADAAGGAVKGFGTAAHTAAPKIQGLAYWVGQANKKYQAGLSALTTYTNDLIGQYNALAALNTALKTSHDRIGLHTQAQRNSFAAANQYIQNTSDTATQAFRSGRGVDAAIRAIKDGLPTLDHAKTKNRAYWEEVRTLHKWLVKLRNLRNIQETITISGNGKWVITRPGTKIGLPGGSAGGPFAAGGYVYGGIRGRDSVPAMLMPGELVVPARMVSAGAVDHLRGRLPGFAAGGIVPDYAGAVKGLQPWGASNWTATIRIITTGIARAMARQFAASIPIPGRFGGGVSQWTGLVRRALAMEGLSPYLTGNVLYQMRTESGGNPNAINLTDVNAARGDPSRGLMQVIMSTFRAYHWPGTSWNIYNPLANIAAALNYARHRYGPTLTSGGMGIGSGHGYGSGGLVRRFDSGGMLPPGLSLSYNGTGRWERLERRDRGRDGTAPLIVIENFNGDRVNVELLAQRAAALIQVPSFSPVGGFG